MALKVVGTRVGVLGKTTSMPLATAHPTSPPPSLYLRGDMARMLWNYDVGHECEFDVKASVRAKRLTMEGDPEVEVDVMGIETESPKSYADVAEYVLAVTRTEPSAG